MNKRRNETRQRAKRTNNAIQRMHERANKDAKYGPEEVIRDFKGKSGYFSEAKRIADRSHRNVNDFYPAIGRKVFGEVIAKMKSQGVTVSDNEKTTLEVLLLADDWFTALKTGASVIAPHVMPFVQQALDKYAPPAAQSFLSKLGLSMPSNVVQSGDGQTISVKKRWLMFPFLVPSANTVYSLICSPARNAFGNWISQLAVCYQYYKVKEIRFQYIPTCSMTTTATVTYGLDLDMLDQPAAANILAQQYKAQSHAAYQASEVVYGEEELQRMVKRYQVAASNEGSTNPQQDFGVFYYSATLSAAALGNMFVEAVFEFSIPNYLPDIKYSSLVQVNTSNVIISQADYFDKMITAFPWVFDYTRNTGELRLETICGASRQSIGRIATQTLEFNFIQFAMSTTVPGSTLGGNLNWYYSSSASGTRTLATVSTTFDYASSAQINAVFRFKIQRIRLPTNYYIWLQPHDTSGFFVPGDHCYLQTNKAVDALPQIPINLASLSGKESDMLQKFLEFTRNQPAVNVKQNQDAVEQRGRAPVAKQPQPRSETVSQDSRWSPSPNGQWQKKIDESSELEGSY